MWIVYHILACLALCGIALTPPLAPQHHDVKLVICVEGPNDVAFLTAISRTAHQADPSIVDLNSSPCEHIRAAEKELSGSRSLETGSISIGASETALHVMLLQKLKAFHALYPNIRLRISNHSTPQALAALKSGSVDLAVVTTPTGASKPLSELPLTPFQEILVGGPGFAKLAERKLTLKSLLEYPLICLGRETMTYRFYEQLFLKKGLPFQVDTEVATTDQVLPLVKNDLGLGFLPEPFAEEALVRGEVYRIPLADQIPKRQVCMVKDSSRTLSKSCSLFLESTELGS